jgi:hypothetical protein
MTTKRRTGTFLPVRRLTVRRRPLKRDLAADVENEAAAPTLWCQIAMRKDER